MTFKIVCGLAVVWLATTASGCPGPTQQAGIAPGFDRATLLEGVGACAVDVYGRLDRDLGALASAAATARDSPGPTTRTAVQAAFVRAFDVWQEAELTQFGPLGPTSQPGGGGLREAFYGWPVDGRCLVDQNLASRSYLDPATFADGALAQGRDLAALEYLVFYNGSAHGCSATSALSTSGVWAALTPAELELRRRDYAARLAAALSTRARALVEAWQRGFLTTLRSAGSPGSPFKTPKLALDVVLEGLFYVDYFAKDRKVGVPSGEIADTACSVAPCPTLVEARLSGSSKRGLRQNLVAFRRLFRGCDGIGFDDFLAAAGGASLAAEVDQKVDAALAAVDALAQPTLEAALVADRASVAKVYQALRALADLLKTDVVSTLQLDLPARVAGDGD